MSEPVKPVFSDRDRRILLWVCAAAVCWRWLLAMRTPVLSSDAAMDLWVGCAVARGELAVLNEVWLGPWWSLMLAGGLTLGFDDVRTAQVLGCIFGGLALVPAALAAQNLRRGAGVATALLLFSVPGPTLAAAGGSAVGLHLLLFGFAVLLAVTRRFVLAAIVAVVAVADALPSSALALGWLAIAIVAGVAMARLPERVRDLVLSIVVGVLFFLSWTRVEPVSVVAEQHLGELIVERLSPDQVLVTTLPRVAYFAERRPQRATLELSSVERADAIVCREREWRETGFASARFERLQLSPRFEDMARAHDIVIYLRKP